MSEFKLPDVGEGLTEAEIVGWKVKVGDVIAINDVIVDIETAKSIVELPSPYAGTVTALLVAEGEMVAVGTPDHRGRGRIVEPEMDLSNPAASGGVEGESLVGRNKADRGPVRRARKVASGAAAAHLQAQAAFEPGAAPIVEAEEPAGPAIPAVSVATAAPRDVRALAKPPVRKLAKDLGVDLGSLPRLRPPRHGHAGGRRGRGCRADLEWSCRRASPAHRDLDRGPARPASRSRASAR